MVVTRRGVRVSPPTRTATDEAPDVQVSPTGRTSRRVLKQVESQSQCTHLEKSDSEHQGSPPASSAKRCSRAARLHSPEPPATPVGSTHDADVSDLESLCSAVSDAETPLTRTKRRAKRSRRGCGGDEELSEVESCSSALSASSAGWSTRRSARRKTLPPRSDAAQGSAKTDSVQDSCGSTVSTSRVTRSQRKAAPARSSTRQTGESELSDPDSYLSSISGADVPKSTNRPAARSRRETGPIPINLDKDGEHTSLTLTPVRQSSRVAARKMRLAAVEVSEPQSCDSEGFESGPSYSRGSRQRRTAKIQDLDSDSDLTDLQSPGGSSCSKQSSSRTSSRNKRPETPNVSRDLVKTFSVVEKNVESAENTSLDDSRLENTVIEAAECTLVEEELEQDPKSNGIETIAETEVPAQDSPSVEDAAVAGRRQQEELCVENRHEDTLELEERQEKAESEPMKIEVYETKEHDVAAGVTETDQLQGGTDVGAALDQEVEARPVDGDDQQVVECFQVTSSQEHNITVDSVSEEEPQVITIQKKEFISLLDSSEEEEDEEEDEEREVSDTEEKRGVPSPKPGAADMAVDGLFMIDTRPGQEADQQYFVEKATEKKKIPEDKAEQEEEEDFVDEEGSDDDDEDADVLYSSRNPLLKEMSSRIDPGIRMKELGGLYINFDGGKSKAVSSSMPKPKDKKIQDEVMKRSVIGADFEKKDAVPPYSESKQKMKLKRRVEKEKTTGDGWFNMKAPEMSQELKGDLQVLKMRGSLDPKRFYKKNDRDGFPKYFQVGTVVDNPVDFYHSQIPKRNRKRTMVEELLADAEFRQ
ncbi:Deoxynucleotidyltransferase terminal-interacting protein 2 [Takifugu flavidus]|uniref:Deoxynucleotidyltransferase terminal-interacting protein 2 n=1 Tax=Takifugu flavidus TaxID=433684 RepID=A0A5C6MST5_9TELE|nr:Deoxynucleotidyltransferase terminal-interacting protein 2 [Takifugu flavidus]